MRVKTLMVAMLCLGMLGCSSDAEKMTSHLEKGQAFLKQEDYKSAEIEFKNVLQISGNNPAAYKGLAEVHLKLGNTTEAFKDYLHIERLMPEDLAIKRKLATFLFLARRFDDAKERIDAVLAKEPQDVEMLFLNAGYQEQKGDAAGAEALFRRIIELDNTQTRAHLALARMLEDRGDEAEAEEHLNHAVKLDPKDTFSIQKLFAHHVRKKDFEGAEAILRKAISENPQDANLRLLLGNFLFTRQRESEAETAYREAVELDPKNPKPLMVLAGFHESMGHNDQALELYEKAASLAPDEPRILTTLARFHLQRGAMDKATEYVDKALAKNPDDAQARLIRAEMLTSQRKFSEAVPLLDKLLTEQPENPRIHYFKGVAEFGLGHPGPAQEALRAALKFPPPQPKARLLLTQLYLQERNYDEAVQMAQETIADMPESYDARVMLGDAYLYKGEPDKARESFEALVNMAPNNPLGHYRLGIAQRATKNNDKALTSFEKALSLNPKLMDVFSSLVLLHAGQGRYKEAFAACERQIAQVKDIPAAVGMVYEIQGGLHMARKEMDAAEASFQKALEVNPNAIRPYYGLANVYLMKNEADKAASQFETLATKNPNEVRPVMMLGILNDMQGKYEDARRHYRGALAIDPNFAPAMNNLAYLIAEHGGELTEALALAQNAKAAMSDDPGIMDTLGWVNYKMGSHAVAVNELEASVKLLEDNPTVHYHLGMAYAALGNTAGAKQHLDKALELDPKSKEAPAIRDALKSLR